MDWRYNQQEEWGFPSVVFAEDLDDLTEYRMCGPVADDGTVSVIAPCHPGAQLSVAFNLGGRSVEVYCSECNTMVLCFAIAMRGPDWTAVREIYDKT